MMEQFVSIGVPAHFYGPLNFHYTLVIGIPYGHWCGGRRSGTADLSRPMRAKRAKV